MSDITSRSPCPHPGGCPAAAIARPTGGRGADETAMGAGPSTAQRGRAGTAARPGPWAPALAASALLASALLSQGCGQGQNPDSATSATDSPPVTAKTAAAATAHALHGSAIAPAAAGLATIAAPQRPSDEHPHNHGAPVADSLTGGPATLLDPGPPQAADSIDGPFRSIVTRDPQRAALALPGNDLVADVPTARAGECVLDFATPNLMQYTPGGSYWGDRTMIPWLRDCGEGRRLDLRWSKYGHMHVSFVDPDVQFCNDADATPSHIDDNGNCTYIDLNSAARGHVTSHWWDEVLVLRAYYDANYQEIPFDLTRVRVAGSSGARVCYRKASEPPSSGPWESAGGHGTGTDPDTAGGWLCWTHLGPGHWDLSAWATDVSRVKITSSALTPSSFAIDDIHVRMP